MFSKVLVANRGEIAVRIIRALDELGIGSVAVYSEADREAQHVKRATEAHLIGPGPASESYLVVEKLLEVVEASGAEAVHPGYGFLAENANFARTLEDNGITFIGPPASAIDAMGSKTKARELMQNAGVPIVPGVTEPVETVEDAKKIAEEIGYPIAVKAAGGGGGKGFRVAMAPENLKDAFEGAAREGEKFFSDDTVYIERYLEDPRHVEVQILADKHGNVIHLGERDCSIQRRHQKLIEESPGPLVDEEMREKIGKIGVDAARAVDYHSAGTIEGLFVKQDDGPDEYFFLEMNTRVQVEHCVTEATTGIDIVREQILIAAGGELTIKQEDVQLRGHAIECRINAENAATNFAPAPGTVTAYREPSGPGIRVDSGVISGSEITPLYDPMVAKLIVWDTDRERATRRMLRALDEFVVEGVTTLMPFHKAIMASEQWANAETCRDLIEDKDWLKSLATDPPPRAEDEDLQERTYTVEVSGKRFDVTVHGEAFAPAAGSGASGGGRKAPQRGERKSAAGGGPDELTSPLQGNMWKVVVAEGDEVEEGQLICIIEAMKMENEITAHKAGKIATLAAKEGEAIKTGDPIATITAAAPAAEETTIPNPRVWRAEPEEAEHVARLLIAFREWYNVDWPSDNAFLAGVERLIESPETEFLLGTPDDDSPPCAVVQLRFRYSIWTAASDCWLEDLFVTDHARRTGLGRAMVLAAVDRAEQRDCRRMELDVDDVNEPARALYQELGFAEKHGGSALMVRPL